MRYSFGGVAGLDYPAVALVAKITGYGELEEWDLDALRILEGDLLSAQSEAAETEKAKKKRK